MAAIQCFGIKASEFNQRKNNFLLNKNSFEKELIRLIITRGMCIRPRVDTVFFFPETLTCAERHRIHTYGKKDSISSKSREKNGKRLLAVILKPCYVTSLVETYFYGK